MAGIRFEVRGLDDVLAALERIVGNQPIMLAMIGAQVESQTRRRIGEERTAPDGTPWPEWSDTTKAQRHSGQSLLQMFGSLLGSLHFDVQGNQVSVGSGLIYSRIQHMGGMAGRNHKVSIPARAYLGLSADNEAELMETIEDYIKRQLSGN